MPPCWVRDDKCDWGAINTFVGKRQTGNSCSSDKESRLEHPCLKMIALVKAGIKERGESAVGWGPTRLLVASLLRPGECLELVFFRLGPVLPGSAGLHTAFAPEGKGGVNC